MHLEAKNFTLFVRKLFPDMFKGITVLDVGSGDINGNNRFLFDLSCKYIGNDVSSGPNVDIVCKTSLLPFKNEEFDTIISTECFEHDPEYDESLKKIYKMLKPGGLFVFTCASTGRGEHGTRRTTPENSFGSRGHVELWEDHYRNLTIADVDKALNLKSSFSIYRSYYDSIRHDLYFWGIKSSEKCVEYPIIEYIANSTVRTDIL